MHRVVQDLRFAVRRLGKTPVFTLTVVLTLAIGVGGTTAIFSLIEGILLRPLPFHDPDRLVLLGDRLEGGLSATPVTAREISTYGSATGAFSSSGAYISARYEVSNGTAPEEVKAARLTAGVFPTLGVQPLLGRVFTEREEENRQPLAVISYALWLNRYHRDPHVIGNSIVLDRKVYSIVGVMPRSFEFPVDTERLDQAQLWVPMSLSADELSDEHAGFWGYRMVARIRDGVTFSQAAQDADRVAKQIRRSFRGGQSAIHIQGTVTPLLEYEVAEVRPLLRILFLAVSTVLLIACVNVAGLWLVQAIRRRGEYAVRLAVGARPRAIIRESMFTGMMLGLGGGVLGLILAAAAIRTTLHHIPASMPRVDSIRIDAAVTGFALLVAVLTGALCSLAPAFAALRTNLTEILKEGAHTGTGASSHSWLRSGLVVAEIAIALVLLTTAGAFVRSFQKMRAVDPGFRSDHVLVAGYQLPLPQYSTPAAVSAFSHALVDRLSTKPGVVAVGLSTAVPVFGAFSQSAYTIEGEAAANWKLKFAMFATTLGDYFRTLRIPLIDGRYFTANDRSDSPLVIIINESMARHCWPGKRAIGQHMHVGSPQKRLPWATVVGVVGDTKMGSRDEPSDDQWYAPAEQPAILYGSQPAETLTEAVTENIVLRSALAPDRLAQILRVTVQEIDPLLALQNVQTLNAALEDVEAPRRFNTVLITAFALAALVLAITGIYAIVAFSVTLRTQEIAIRMALGAQRDGIARLVLGWGVKLTLVGCGLGVVVSLATARLVSSFLFGVAATEPTVYMAAVMIMTFTALLATVFPALRAASACPTEGLRSA